jgi:hypothetical protein
MISICTSFILPLNQLMISIKEAIYVGKTFGSLVDSWVLLDDASSVMRNSPSLMAFAERIGKPIDVDEVSLSRVGPVHMQILCFDPSRVRGFMKIFPGSSAYRISVQVEG